MKILLALLVTLFVSCGQKQSPPISVPGPQGDQGLSGEKGEKGDAGIDGQNGSNGADGLNGANGQDGASGANGDNGFSLVSQPRSATPSECPNGGSALDVYSDLDRSGTVTPGDQWQSALLTCQGSSGAVFRTPNSGFLDNSCVAVAGTSLFAKRKSTHSEVVEIFETSVDCDSDSNEVGELRSSSDETFFTEGGGLLVLEGSNSSNLVLRTVVFF